MTGAAPTDWLGALGGDALRLMPTPADTLVRDGTARLLRFRAPDGRRPKPGLPLLLVPSLINRWYILDLRPGASLVEALVAAGHDVFCIDWGVPNDEDRYLEWDDVLARLARLARATRRVTGARQLGVLGYCMGATLTAIDAALHPERIAALCNLAGPIDFSESGRLGEMTDPRWFDPEAVAAPGNVAAQQMQAGFVALRPTSQIAKWVSLADGLFDAEKRKAYVALETWASDNIAFPAAAYTRYVRELYQENRLARGTHAVRGERVDLCRVRCPILVVGARRDTICPPAAACALGPLSGSEDVTVELVDGGHVGAVVGRRASRTLYPTIGHWFAKHLRG